MSVDVGYFRRLHGHLLVIDNRVWRPPTTIRAPSRRPLIRGFSAAAIRSPGLYSLNAGKTVGKIVRFGRLIPETT